MLKIREQPQATRQLSVSVSRFQRNFNSQWRRCRQSSAVCRQSRAMGFGPKSAIDLASSEKEIVCVRTQAVLLRTYSLSLYMQVDARLTNPQFTSTISFYEGNILIPILLRLFYPHFVNLDFRIRNALRGNGPIRKGIDSASICERADRGTRDASPGTFPHAITPPLSIFTLLEMKFAFPQTKAILLMQ